ncbi:hypothetical protein [Sulfuricurvum sp.]|uniref:hypothetical protein n=1 Tax=Sulfuricurvum sp. TaxID=2025608 RepID=UPI00262AA87A|nr:hypothetical protein [Sulfuricurvum sp.]MDD2782300.1 hypothetical protein [Sulfuricurvum sp.]
MKEFLSIKGVDMNNEIEVLCPSPKCSKVTTGYLESTACQCGQELTSDSKPTKYIKKPWIVISTTVAFLSGVVGTVGGEYYLVKDNLSNEKMAQSHTPNRYSINDEYLILNSCISEDQRPLQYSYLFQKKAICVCALEKTQLIYSTADYKQNYSAFLKTFETKANECMDTNASAAEPAAEALSY